MKKVIFLAHDPGGHDVIFPLFEKFYRSGFETQLYCIGPAGVISPQYNTLEATWLSTVQHLISGNQMQLLVTGTSWGNHIEIQSINLCKSAGILTVSVLDYWVNYASRFKDTFDVYIYPDIYIVMDELAKYEAIKEGVPPEIIIVKGHPGMDRFVQVPRLEEINVKEVKRLLFLSQPISLLYEKQLGYTEQSALQDCIEVVKSIRGTQLSVKFHPKDDKSFQQQYRDISVDGLLSELFPQFDLIIGMSTMGLLHAFLSKVPVISYQPNLIGQDFCIASRLRLIPLVQQYELLGKQIERSLQESRLDVVHNYSLDADTFLWTDGKSVERIFEFLMGVLK